MKYNVNIKIEVEAKDSQDAFRKLEPFIKTVKESGYFSHPTSKSMSVINEKEGEFTMTWV